MLKAKIWTRAWSSSTRRASWYVNSNGMRHIAIARVTAAPARRVPGAAVGVGGGAAEQLEIDLAQEGRREEPQRRRRPAIDDQRIAVGGLRDEDAVGGDRVVLVAAQRLDEGDPGQRRDRHLGRDRQIGTAAPAPRGRRRPAASAAPAASRRDRARPGAACSVCRRDSGSGVTPAQLEARVGQHGPGRVPGARVEVQRREQRSTPAVCRSRGWLSTPAYSASTNGPAERRCCTLSVGSARLIVVDDVEARCGRCTVKRRADEGVGLQQRLFQHERRRVERRLRQR